MSKIALFLPDLSGGGAERSFINLAVGFADLGHDVDLVTSRMSGPYADQIPKQIRLINLETKSTLISTFSLAKYLRSERPDALYSALTNANIAAIWAGKLSRTNIPIVISLRNNITQFEGHAAGFDGKVVPKLIKIFYPFADAIVSVSAGVADDCTGFTGISREKITVIYNPVVSDDLFEKAAEPVEHAWFQSQDLPIVLAAGRMNAQKDFTTLIRAFAKVVRSRPSRLVILGEGNDRQSLTELVDSLGLQEFVSMPGFASNPYAYMSKARLFVLSSLHEGLPGVVIQALACGCPVVSTDCPSGPSEILENGKYGTLVPINNPEALGDAILAELAKPKITPPVESWKPYLFDTATRKYEAVVFSKTALPTATVTAGDLSVK